MRISSKLCALCTKKFKPTGRNHKFCAPCKPIRHKEYCKQLHKDTYVRKGYTLRGPSHPNWKDGHGVYKNLIPKTKCERCDSIKFLLVHHRDHNRRNNVLSNLECLCKKCHQEHHLQRDSKGRFAGARRVE